MSVTTLEEVFIKVAHGTNTHADAEAGREAKVHSQTQISDSNPNIQMEDAETGRKNKVVPVTDFGKVSRRSYSI